MDNICQNALLGDHHVFFYASSKLKHNVLFSNLKIGMDNDCSALYIVSGESIEHIKAEMRDFGLKLDNPNKLKIVTSKQWYIPEGEFNAERVKQQYKSLIDENVDRGFKGLYVSGDCADIFDYLSKNLTEWLRYENAFGRTLKFPMEAVCAYRADQIESNDQALLQLIRAHKNTMTPKTASILDNRKLYYNAITEGFSIFGTEPAEVIFYHIEKLLKTSRSQFPDRIEDFDKALGAILGSNSTTIINQQISKKLKEKIEL